MYTHMLGAVDALRGPGVGSAAGEELTFKGNLNKRMYIYIYIYDICMHTHVYKGVPRKGV